MRGYYGKRGIDFVQAVAVGELWKEKTERGTKGEFIWRSHQFIGIDAGSCDSLQERGNYLKKQP